MEKKDKRLIFLLSYGFRMLLDEIINEYDNEIARTLLNMHKRIKFEVSYIDVSSDIDKVKFITYDKAVPFIKEKGYDLNSPDDVYKVRRAWLEDRQNLRVGRFLNKLLKNSGEEYSPKEIEEFVNIYKTKMKMQLGEFTWDRVQNNDMNKWYLYDYYVKGGGTLNRSCLRKKDRNKFVNFLSNNSKSCRLIILKNDKNRLLGRALMWRLNDPDGRFFMDRIYTRFDDDINQFIQLANERGWLYKSKQTYGGDIPIIDGRTGEEKVINMKINNFRKINFQGYPYLDTFQYYNPETLELTNDSSVFTEDGGFIKLSRIDGGYYRYGQDDQEGDVLD